VAEPKGHQQAGYPHQDRALGVERGRAGATASPGLTASSVAGATSDLYVIENLNLLASFLQFVNT